MPNISQAVTKSAARMGPRMKPIAPKNMRPPSVEKKMSSSCILVSWPTSRGRSRLSTLPTTRAQNSGEGDPPPDLAGGDQDDRRRHPDERAADAGDDRQDGHHRPPEDRPVKTHGPERQPSKEALSHADQNRALERRAGNRHELLQHALLVDLRERQVREHAPSRPGPPVRKKNIV